MSSSAKPGRPALLTHAVTALILSLASADVPAENYFPAPVYVTLRDSGKIARYPGQIIWQGGPKMLYTSITPDGKTIVASSPEEGGIYIFDTKTGKQQGKVITGAAAKGLKISPDGREVLVCNEAGNSVSVVDLAGKKVVATIDTPRMPHNVRFTNDGTTAYVTLQGAAALGVIDVKQRKLIRIISTPGIDTPHNLDLSRDEKEVFIRDTAGQVGVLDLASEKIIKIIKVGKGHAGIDVIPDGKLVFTGAIADDVVTVIDSSTLQVVKTIKTGFGPHGVRASLDNRYVYVTVTADDEMSVIDAKNMTVVKTFKVKSFPFWAAVRGNP